MPYFGGITSVSADDKDDEVQYLGSEPIVPSENVLSSGRIIPFQRKTELQSPNLDIQDSSLPGLYPFPPSSSRQQDEQVLLRKGQVNNPQDLLQSRWDFHGSISSPDDANSASGTTQEERMAFSRPSILRDHQSRASEVRTLSTRPRPSSGISTSSSDDALNQDCNETPLKYPVNDIDGIEWLVPKVERRPTGFEIEKLTIPIADDDDEEKDVYSPSGQPARRVKPKKCQPGPDDTIVDFEGDSALELEEYMHRQSQVSRARNTSSKSSSIIPQRNAPIVGPLKLMNEVKTTFGFTLRRGKTVQLKDGDFLLITTITRDAHTMQYSLRGFRLQRTRSTNGLFPTKLNELCLVAELDRDDPRPYTEQSIVEVPLADVRCVRALHITNEGFPSHSYRSEVPYMHHRQAEKEGVLALRWLNISQYSTAKDRLDDVHAEHCVLHLRADHVEQLNTFRKGYLGRDVDRRVQWRGGYENLYEDVTKVSTKRYRDEGILESERSESFNFKRARNLISASARGPRSETCSTGAEGGETIILDETATKPGSNSIIDLTEGTAITERVCERVSALALLDPLMPSREKDMTTSEDTSSTPRGTPPPISHGPPSIVRFEKNKQTERRSRKYTFADAFCGAGGTTKGAELAGLKILWGLDSNSNAGQAWKSNFPGATLHQMWAHELIELAWDTDMLKADMLHLSPPCQYFSPAHTVAGKNDDMNSASMFACGDLIDAAKPRTVTLEQTFGITHPRYNQFLNGLLRMFTERGFSARWKVADLQRWGLPQRRKRLIIIAAGPGEVLPEFPPYTHSEHGEGGLQHFTSVDSVIKSIPSHAPNHDIARAIKRDLLPWDGNSIAPRCITTSGGQNYHPEGKRDFTHREIAALQGFTNFHKFSRTGVKMQIGNAFPTTVVEVLYRHLRKALEKADGIEPEVIPIN